MARTIIGDFAVRKGREILVKPHLPKDMRPLAEFHFGAGMNGPLRGESAQETFQRVKLNTADCLKSPVTQSRLTQILSEGKAKRFSSRCWHSEESAEKVLLKTPDSWNNFIRHWIKSERWQRCYYGQTTFQVGKQSNYQHVKDAIYRTART